MSYLTRAPYSESRLAWLKRVHPIACPECRPSTTIPASSTYARTAWCPICERVWKISTVPRAGGGTMLIWYPEASHATAKELPR